MFASFSILSHPLVFVKRFFKNSLEIFKFPEFLYSPLTASRLRQPYYLITSSSLCQELFYLFFKIFSFPLRSGALLRELFSLSWAAFRGFLRSVSLRQLCYSNTIRRQSQALFSRNFMFVDYASFIKPVIDIRH